MTKGGRVLCRLFGFIIRVSLKVTKCELGSDCSTLYPTKLCKFPSHLAIEWMLEGGPLSGVWGVCVCVWGGIGGLASPLMLVVTQVHQVENGDVVL